MRHLGLPILILLFLLLTISPLAAQGAPPIRGAVQGVVTDPGGTPLTGIEVVLYKWQDDHWVFQAWQNNAGDGSYAFTELEDGSYTFLTRDWSRVWAYHYYDGATLLADATPIAVLGAAVTIDVALEPAGRITGALTAPGGEPLDYPLIFVWDDSDPRQVIFHVTPDEFTGAYDLGGLPSGNFYIQFTGRQGLDSYVGYYDGAATLAEADPIAVLVGQTTGGIDGELGLPPGGVIKGDILDPYGRTFDFAAAEAYAWTGSAWELAGRAETLFYESPFSLAVPPGTYRLRFEAGSFLQEDLPTAEVFDDVLELEDGADVTVALGQTLSGYDATVGNLASGSLSGTVSEAGTGTPLVGIEVYPADRKGRVLWDQVAVTDVNGDYTVERLWPEAYTLEYYDPGFVYASQQGPPVLVGESAVTGVDAALTAAPGVLPGSISGTVTYEGGAPIFNARVSTVSLADPEIRGSASTDGAGNYRIRDLPAGAYHVYFSTSFAVPEYYDDAASAADATAVTVLDAADTFDIDAALAPAGVITGRITDVDGDEFSIATATAYAFDGTAWQSVSSTGILFASEYRLRSIPVGQVRVRFTGKRGAAPHLIEYYDDVKTLAEATDINVPFGVVVDGIDGFLGDLPPGAISGTVTDGGGTLLEGIVVRVYDGDLDLEEEVETGADGTYEVVGLFDGETYYVEFIDPSGAYPSEAWNDVASLELATPIVINGGPVTGINAALDGSTSGPGGGGFRGTVTDAQSGLPVAGIRVRCTSAVESPYSPDCSTVTAADGTYQLAGFLPAGDYLIQFRSNDGFWATEWYDDVTQLASATPVAATVGTWTDGIDAALEPAGAISGRVTDENGQAYPLLTVTAFFRVGSSWQPYKSLYEAYDSQYRIGGLPAGTWRLRFRGSSISDPSSGVVEFYDDKNLVQAGTDIEVLAGQVTTRIDAVLGNVNGPPIGLVDPEFDEGVMPWTAAIPTGSSLEYSALDRDTVEGSGSARILSRSGPDQRFEISQCVEALSERRYRFGGWLRIEGGTASAPTGYAEVSFHADTECGGEPLASLSTTPVAGTTAWTQVSAETTSPLRTLSARVVYQVVGGAASSFDAWWDGTDFEEVFILWVDNFESGSLAGWSTTVGAQP